MIGYDSKKGAIMALPARQSGKSQAVIKTLTESEARDRITELEAERATESEILQNQINQTDVAMEAVIRLEAENARLREDAIRWRGLMSSQRIRIIGAAGMDFDRFKIASPENVHIGVEFWTTHQAAHPSEEYPQDTCRAVLKMYADNVATLNKETEGEK